jgi:hypothetical protein
MFVRTGESNVNRIDDVPTTALTDIEACANPAPPRELQTTVVSVTQLVAWQGHRPKSTACARLVVPKFFPKSVTEKPRETAEFEMGGRAFEPDIITVLSLTMTVITAASNVKLATALCMRPSTIVATSLSRPDPAARWMLSVVALTYVTD